MSTPKLKKNPPLHSVVRRSSILLTEDDKLRAFANAPEEQYTPKLANNQTTSASSSLKDVCEQAKHHKAEIITFFHDHFFGGGERELHLTHPEFIDCTKKISEYAETYGIGIGASVTNPLDLGRNFKQDKGVGGQHRFFAEGVKEADGSFKFNGVLSERWTNNKGHIYPQYNHARLFTYTEEDNGSAYLVIKPESIIEIPESDYTCTISTEPYDLSTYFGNRHMIVEGNTKLPGNRVFAIFYMDTPEMDYFHPDVTEYIHGVIDMYRREGVEFMELYSDEMHIQFDWGFAHFGPYEIPTRYMTENFQSKLAKVDPIFADFDKALIYFGYDMLADRNLLGRSHTQHVIGSSAADLYRTFRMRRTYFEMLQDQVVGMCCEARDYIRDTYVKHKGWDPLCLGHATWQESPTCDHYAPGRGEGRFHHALQRGYCTFDYSPDYVYSSTIREAISGCYDYFKWNDYFSYGGTDFCECGWFDRNYYGGAMSASLGALNRNEVASWGAWGFPTEARKRFNNVSLSFSGGGRGTREAIVTYGRPRDIDVLYVYPKDLTAVEERFGSWMVQYGYCNYCPADRIVNLGTVEKGKLKLGIGNYSTIVVGFEPFYNEAFIALLEKFVRGGGNLVWNAAPSASENGKIPARWLRLFGLKNAQNLVEGGSAHEVNFMGILAGIPKMKVSTDMLPDRIYNVTVGDGEAVANANNFVIGATRKYGLGRATYIGCRLRDDQSGESGDAPSTLFDILKRLGAYGGDEAIDNPYTIARKSEYFATRFANGAYSLCRHYKTMRELWPDGSFRRNEEADNKFLETYDLMVPLELNFEDFSVDGHKITYTGKNLLQYRLSSRGKLIGFRGDATCGITVDGKTYKITKEPANTIFNVIEESRLPDGYSMGWIVSSNAPVVDICTKIPENAEIYHDVDTDGEILKVDERLSFKGSKIYKEGIPTVVILVK